MDCALQVGDTVLIRRTKLEVEVIAMAPTPEQVLCGWFDDSEEFQEVYFRVEDLDIVKQVTPA